jgi:transposase-like protein
MMDYSKGFKERMVQRMTGIDAVSATVLSREVGVPQPTLSRWLRQASHNHPFCFHESISEEVTTMPKRRPQDWSAEEKFQVVLESCSLTGEQLGVFLRSKGLHESQLEQWRSQMLNGLHGKTSVKKAPPKKGEAKEIKELKQELARKDKALAEASALLVLKKKAQAIWGDEDDDTPSKNGG